MDTDRDPLALAPLALASLALASLALDSDRAADPGHALSVARREQAARQRARAARTTEPPEATYAPCAVCGDWDCDASCLASDGDWDCDASCLASDDAEEDAEEEGKAAPAALSADVCAYCDEPVGPPNAHGRHRCARLAPAELWAAARAWYRAASELEIEQLIDLPIREMDERRWARLAVVALDQAGIDPRKVAL